MVFGRDLLTEDSVLTTHRPSNLLETRNSKQFLDKKSEFCLLGPSVRSSFLLKQKRKNAFD